MVLMNPPQSTKLPTEASKGVIQDDEWESLGFLGMAYLQQLESLAMELVAAQLWIKTGNKRKM